MRPQFAAMCVLALVASGCITPEFVANKAGFLSGTGYLAVNNPPVDEVKAVRKVLDKVNKYVDRLGPKDTFAELYKPISDEISGELSGTTKVLALSITRTALDGLDIFFAGHPKWAEKKELVVALTTEFVKGVNSSFDMFATNEGVRANMARLRSASAKAYRAARSP